MAPERRLTVNRNPPVNRSTNQNNVDINSGIDTQMLNQLIATRVAEALAAAAVTHAASTQEKTNLRSNSSQNKTCNYKEFRAVMHESFRGTEGAVGLTRWFEKLESQFGIANVARGCAELNFASSTLLDGALTWWNVYVRSVTLDTAHATPWSDFKAMFIRKYCPRNEIKQMENELWNLKVKGLPLNIKGNVTSSKPVDLHEAIEMAQELMYQVVQELGENSGDKWKWNGNHYNHNPNNTNNTSNLNPNKRPETARVFSAGQRHKAKTASSTSPCKPSRTRAKRTGQLMFTCFGSGREKGHNKKQCPNQWESLGSTQGGRRVPGRVYILCAKAVVKDNNVVNGTFLINDVYASVLFDTGADRSFVSYAFSKYIDFILQT
ncbi:reverse transcriptase domain-containing protein [Tanacetum coccineum]